MVLRGTDQINSNLSAKYPVNVTGRWSSAVVNNNSFVYRNTVFLDFYIDKIYPSGMQYFASVNLGSAKTKTSIGSVVFMTEHSENIAETEIYQSAVFMAGTTITIGQYPGMNNSEKIENAHFLGTIQIYYED